MLGSPDKGLQVVDDPAAGTHTAGSDNYTGDLPFLDLIVGGEVVAGDCQPWWMMRGYFPGIIFTLDKGGKEYSILGHALNKKGAEPKLCPLRKYDRLLFIQLYADWV